MREGKVQVSITADSKSLSSGVRRSEGYLRAFGNKARSIMSQTGQRITGMAEKLSPFAMIGGAAGMIQLTRQAIDFQDSLSTLGIRAGLSGEEMMRLDNRFQSLARSSGQTREGVVRAMQAMVDDIDVDSALAMIDDVATTATAMSISIEDSAKAFTIFRRDMGATSDEAMELVNTMFAMDSSFSIDRLANATSLFGVSKDNFANYNAALHAIKNNVGGLAKAERVFERIGMAFQDPEVLQNYQRRLGENAKDIFDAQGNIKDFELFLSSLQESDIVMKDLRAHFGNDAFKAIDTFDKRTFDEFISSGRNGTFVMDAFTRKQGEAKYQFNRLTEAGKEFATNTILPGLSKFTDALSTVSTEDWAVLSMHIQGISATLGVAAGHAIRMFNAVSTFSSNVGGEIAQRRSARNRHREVYENHATQLSDEKRREIRERHGFNTRNDFEQAYKTQEGRARVNAWADEIQQTHFMNQILSNRAANAPQIEYNPTIENQTAFNATFNIVGNEVEMTRVDGSGVTANVQVNRGGLTR